MFPAVRQLILCQEGTPLVFPRYPGISRCDPPEHADYPRSRMCAGIVEVCPHYRHYPFAALKRMRNRPHVTSAVVRRADHSRPAWVRIVQYRPGERTRVQHGFREWPTPRSRPSQTANEDPMPRSGPSAVRRGGEAPAHHLASAERNHGVLAPADTLWHQERLLPQRHPARIWRQAIKFRTIQRGKGLEAVERLLLLKDLGVSLQSTWRREDAGATAGGLFGRNRVRRAVGAEKELLVAGGRRAAQGQAVLFALCDRQAIEMRADPAGKDSVAIDLQMMRGDRCRQVRLARADISDSLLGRDVFEDDAQLGQPPPQRVQYP